MSGKLDGSEGRILSGRIYCTRRGIRNRHGQSGRVLYIVLGIVALLVALGVAAILLHVLDSGGARELAAAQAEARAAGLPIDYSDAIFQRYENTAALGRNAATIYAEAFELMPASQSEQRDPNLPVEGNADLPDDARTPLSPEMLSAVREYVSARERALELIHEASGVTPCLFPIHWKGPDTDLPNLASERDAARLVLLSVILHGEDGDPHAGISSVLDGLALGRPLAEEPLLISNLVAFAVDSVTLSGAQRLLARTEPNGEDLAALQKQFEACAEALSIRGGLAGEMANMSEAFRMLEEGRVPGATNSNSPSGTKEPAGSTRVNRLAAWFFKNDMKGANAEAIRMLVKLVADAEKPTSGVLGKPYETALDSQLGASKYRFTMMVRLLVAPDLAAIRQCEIARAKLRSAAACVAALRFRKDAGAWPASLEALVPKYLTAVPLDPFTGKPLIYRIRDDGIVVYSVGMNGTDDGGKKLLVKPDETDSGAYDDAGFRIWK